MTRALPFTETSLRRAMRAARKAGFKVIGIRPDGTVVLDDGDSSRHEVAGGRLDVQAMGASKWEDVEA